MKWTTIGWNWLAVSLVGVAVLAQAGLVSAEAPAAPKVSTFAPAEDLVGQVDAYLGRLEEAVGSEADFKDAEGKIARDANTLILVSLALGLHDTDNKYKAAAPAMVKAGQQVAAAKDYAAAKAAVAELKKAAEAGAASGELKWEKVATLSALMKQVPMINTKLKRNMRRFSTKAKESAGDTATLAVIAQGSMANSDETKKPGEVKEWYKYCEQMRDAAAAVNAAIHAGDQKAADKQMKAMTKSCDDCHAVFNPETAGETGK
jgi:hypothetical protein